MNMIRPPSLPERISNGNVSGSGRSRGISGTIKRLFDIAFAGLALIFTSPLIMVGALATKLSSQGPAFYRARRAGLEGRPFAMFKLRTMRLGADSLDRRITAERDDRITPVGRWLRRLKIDELPQFWNVLRGDMSIVGPRPEDWDLVERYYSKEQRRTLEIRPGIASPAEILWYPDLTYHDPAPPGVTIQEHYINRHLPAKLAVEMEYVEKHTLLLDLKVIGQTAFCILVYSWQKPERRPILAEAQGGIER